MKFISKGNKTPGHCAWALGRPRKQEVQATQVGMLRPSGAEFRFGLISFQLESSDRSFPPLNIDGAVLPHLGTGVSESHGAE